jgi:hypothetical protein
LVGCCGVSCDYNALQSQRIKNLQVALSGKILQIQLTLECTMAEQKIRNILFGWLEQKHL